MITLTFQVSLLALIAVSFIMIIAVPVIFASPNGWDNNKSSVLLGAAIWIFLVFTVAILNYFVI